MSDLSDSFGTVRPDGVTSNRVGGGNRTTDFYLVPLFRCSVHGTKPAAYEIRRHPGDRYRLACSEVCANKQIAELVSRITGDAIE